MAQIIEDLLHLSRIGRDDFMAIPLDLGRLAEQVLTGLQTSDPGRKVACEVPHPLRVQGDPRLLQILLENLLGNAWKFTSHTPDARITVTSQVLPAGGVEISIRDNGAGFPASQSGKLFAPFHRLHKSDEFPGTGIGLAIAKRIVSRHGGMIRAEGETGRGAVIRFTLPAVNDGLS
jgi:signal transduction histidine kinase